MLSARAALIPALVALSLTLSGCFLSEYPPSVLITIGKQCDTKADATSDEVGLKDVLGGEEGCGSMNANRLTELGVDDCATVLHEVVHFMLGAECEFTTANSEGVQASCGGEFSADACPAAVESAVAAFQPFSEDSMFSDLPNPTEEEGVEETMALIQACHSAAENIQQEAKFKEEMKDLCQKGEDGLDKGVMKAMGVKKKDCKQYIKDQSSEIGTIMCAMVTMMSFSSKPDFPGPQAVTKDELDAAVQEVVGGWVQSVTEDDQGFIEAIISSAAPMVESMMSQTDMTPQRLFSNLRRGRWQRLRRARSFASIAAVSAACCVALLAVALRLRAARRPTPAKEAEPMLEAPELQVELPVEA